MRRSTLFALALLWWLLLPLTSAWAQAGAELRCQSDALPADLAEARLEWMRRCALQSNVGNPGMGFNTGVPATNDPSGLIDYSEGDYYADPYGYCRYTGPMDIFDVNNTYADLLYLSGGTTQSTDANGYAKWTRSASRKKLRPQYPIYGNSPSTYSTQLFPSPTLGDCNLYSGRNGTGASTFYVTAYCESVPTTVLSNNVALGGLGDSTNGSKYHSITVPANAGKLIVETSGGSGEADLYVRFGNSPTQFTYDCRPMATGNTESCVIDNPSAGTWYVMVQARSSYSGVTLKAQYPVVNVDIAGCQTNVAINNAVAQSFRVSATTALERIEFWMKPELYYTTSYAIEVYDSEGTGGAWLGTSPSITLGSQTGGWPSTWYNFSFSGQGIVLQPNRAYTFRLVRLSQYSGAFSYCSNVYSNGILYWLGYSAMSYSDASFRLYGT